MSGRSSFPGGVPPTLIQQLGDAFDAGLFGVDRLLTVTIWNGWLEAATGLKASRVIGRPLVEVQPELRPRAKAALARAIAGETVILSHALHEYFLDVPAPAEYRGFARMQQSARIVPVLANDGTPDGAIVIIQDVTERVAQEAKLREAVRAAQAANEAKSEFLAAMSHELRTPIGAISGYADLLAEGISGPVSEAQRVQLLRIKAVSGHLLSVVEQILAFARLGAERETPKLSPVDACALAREAVVAVEPQVAAKGLEVSCVVPDHLVSMNTDPTWVRQILINMLGNAVKFTDRGHITVGVTVVNDAAVQFTVADTGRGIAVHDQARIFEPFVQVTNRRSGEAQGTGLGLSVSRALARRLGGDLTLDSTLGVGSTFTATLSR